MSKYRKLSIKILGAAIGLGLLIACGSWPANPPDRARPDQQRQPPPAITPIATDSYQRPVLRNPITVYLNNDHPTYWGKGDDDVVVVVQEKITKPVTIKNARNVVLVGGEFTINAPLTAKTKDSVQEHRALAFQFISGTVYLEGIWINNSGGGLTEGLQFFAPGKLILRNSRIEGVHTRPGDTGFSYNHPDLLQVMNGSVALENVTLADSDFQGLMFGHTDGEPISELTFRNVNTYAVKRQAWFFAALDGADPVVKGCENCWHDPTGASRSGDLIYTLYPHPVLVNGNAVWKGIPRIQNGTTILRGRPPQGDFAPADKVGRSYDPQFFGN